MKAFLLRHKLRLIGLLIVLTLFTGYQLLTKEKVETVSFNEFQSTMKAENVKDVSIDFDAATFTYHQKGSKTLYKTDNPRIETFKQSLLTQKITVNEIEQSSAKKALLSIGQLAATLFIIIFAMRMVTGGRSKVGKKYEKTEVPNVTFDSIAGNEEAKEEMMVLVDFLKNKKKFIQSGARTPKGVVFYGESGTGKTLLARAVAGEAGVPFFSASGSDFIEMYVGVGAKRVRSLFEQARKESPAIIFIDEIDAMGGKRSAGNNSEDTQTINALLTELDGFSGDEGILVIAATNRIDTLDEALIRPGRFDKHISISLPQQKEREEILQLHAKNKTLAKNVDLVGLSKTTIGLSGASLESIMNEAAILSAVAGREEIVQEDVDVAFYKSVTKSNPRKNQQDRKKEELELVAWHEAGHAILAKALTSNTVPKVTIISSTNGMGGVTFIVPTKLGLLSKKELRGQIMSLYGGRIAELLLLGDEEHVTTGASQDIKQATEHIKHYIAYYGMSDEFGMLSPVAFKEGESKMFEEAKKLSKDFYQQALSYLTEHKVLLQNVAEALMKHETLDEGQLDAVLNAYYEKRA